MLSSQIKHPPVGAPFHMSVVGNMKPRTKSPAYASEPTSDAPGTEVCPSNKKWYEDLATILSHPTTFVNRFFVIIAVLMIAALAIAWWGVSTEHPNIALGAFVTFLLAMLVWIAVSMFVIGTVLINVTKWLISRHNCGRFKK